MQRALLCMGDLGSQIRQLYIASSTLLATTLRATAVPAGPRTQPQHCLTKDYPTLFGAHPSRRLPVGVQLHNHRGSDPQSTSLLPNYFYCILVADALTTCLLSRAGQVHSLCMPYTRSTLSVAGTFEMHQKLPALRPQNTIDTIQNYANLCLYHTVLRREQDLIIRSGL